MFDLDYLLNASKIQLGYVITSVIMFFIYRLFLCFFIYADGKERDIKSKKKWAVLSLIFGVVAAVIYGVCYRKKKDRYSVTPKKCYLVIMIVSLVVSHTAYNVFNLSNTGEFGYILNPEIGFDESSVVTFGNSRGRKVILDKMGNEYTFSQRNGLLYFDENGVAYKCLDDTWSTLFNTDTQQKYSEDDYDFYINDEGYLCIFENLHELCEYSNEYCDVYYDDEHLYYSLSDVCWDREGNVVFPEFIEEVNDYTYDMVASEI